MTTKSLRVEFVVTGSAMLLALFALDQAGDLEVSSRLFGDALDQEASSGAGFLTLGVLVATAYVIGVFCVFVTFRWPTEVLISRVRHDRLDELTNLDNWMRTKGAATPEDVSILDVAFGHPASSEDPDDVVAVRHSRSVAQTLARISSSDSLIREYEYRRSNRQVLTGLLPALVIFALAGLVGSSKDGPVWLVLVPGSAVLAWVSCHELSGLRIL